MPDSAHPPKGGEEEGEKPKRKRGEATHHAHVRQLVRAIAKEKDSVRVCKEAFGEDSDKTPSITGDGLGALSALLDAQIDVITERCMDLVRREGMQTITRDVVLAALRMQFPRSDDKDDNCIQVAVLQSAQEAEARYRASTE
jgi:hypothetical protein